jgi:hypothetical protein
MNTVKKPNPPPERLAIVAVHGIADQKPGETARAIADMLLRLDGEGTGTYSPCVETGLRIPVSPVVVNNPDASHQPSHSNQALASGEGADGINPTLSQPKLRLRERSQYVRQLQDTALREELNANLAAAAVQPAEDFGHHFMREQLRDYRPRSEDKIYSTVRLATERAVDGRVTHDVHLYEMYWGDLSKLGGGIFRLIGEMYQLLFHIGSLGRQTVDFAYAEHLHDRSAPFWKIFSGLQTWASRLLTLTSPILNLFLLAAVMLLLPTGLPDWLQGPVSQGIAGVISLLTVAVQLRKRQVLPWTLWALAPWIAAAAATLGTWWVQHYGWVSTLQILMIEWSVVVTIGTFYVLYEYDQRRPGALSAGWYIGMLIGLPLTWLIGRAGNTAQGVVDAALPIVEGLFLLIGLNWLSLALLTAGTMIAGIIAVLAVPRSPRDVRSRAWRAAETAWLTLSLPSLSFLLVTLIAYQAVHVILHLALNSSGTLELLYQPYATQLLSKLPPQISVDNFLSHLIVVSATPAFGLTIYLLLGALLLVCWGLFPGIMADISIARDVAKLSADALGKWLSDGYRLLYVAALLVLMAFPFCLSAGVIYWAMTGNSPANRDSHMLATVVVSSIGGLLAFHGRLESLALGFRPILDAVLDVDNYLREHPRDNNPRSRICARYASLLRYLCAYRDPEDGRAYTGIIIVSHSQGTVISAELLRFLRTEYDPQLEGLGTCIDSTRCNLSTPQLPIYLMTMGCPLRQLYGWRFPHMYRWARHDDDTEWSAGPYVIPDGQLPAPHELGITAWINGYRSGDYVGRYLWRSPKLAHEWDVHPSEDLDGQRREFCIGTGAHTHYFDDTAPEIAREVDRICALMTQISKAEPSSYRNAA